MADQTLRAPYGRAAPARAYSVQRLTNIAGAAVSLGLVIGISIWGYQMMMRDVSGVPVVRALGEPMRVEPDDPGGRPADHQGLAVNAVAAQGTAAPPPDRLILAPRPVALTDEDLPAGNLAELSVQPETRPEGLAEEDDEPRARPLTGTTVEDLVEELTAGADDDDTIVAPEPLDGETMIETAAADAEGIDAPGLRVSLVPQARPAGLSTVRTAAVETPSADAAPETAGANEISPEALPVGTRLAQLGAFDSPEAAREVWERMSVNFADYLRDKQRVIERATSGGRVFYRLRAHGFEDLSDARRFCSALVAEGTDCIPVTTR